MRALAVPLIMLALSASAAAAGPRKPPLLVAYKCGDALCLTQAGRHASWRLISTARPWPQWDPAFAPDARTIAFRGYYADGDGAYALYSAGVDRCPAHRLTRSIAGNPSWSPNGKWIAFDTSGYGSIYKIRPDGSGLALLARGHGANENWSPAWSPSGTRIAYVHDRKDGVQIWTMDSSGQGKRLLYVNPKITQFPSLAWSHDGRKIAFVAQTGGEFSIEGMNANGTEVHALTPGSKEAWNPVWLPGDSGIAFLAGSGGKGHIFVMRPDGSDVHQLVGVSTEQFTLADAPTAKARC
jgi:TolB protein